MLVWGSKGWMSMIYYIKENKEKKFLSGFLLFCSLCLSLHFNLAICLSLNLYSYLSRISSVEYMILALTVSSFLYHWRNPVVMCCLYCWSSLIENNLGYHVLSCASGENHISVLSDELCKIISFVYEAVER